MKPLLLILIVTLTSCTLRIEIPLTGSVPLTKTENYDAFNNMVSSDSLIRSKAFYAAEYYLEQGMDYQLGGDDEIYIPPYRGIDCSGLVINSYKYAVSDTFYSLPFSDATANKIMTNYSNPVENPEKGDLIFWLNDNGEAFHVALFEKTEGSRYYFIESNILPEYNINGVARRSLSEYTKFKLVFSRVKLVNNNSLQ